MDRRNRQDFRTYGTGYDYPTTSGYYDYYNDDYYNDYQDNEGSYQGRSGGSNWLWVTAGTLMAAVGGYLLYQSMSSQDSSRRTERALERGKGIHVRKSITVERPVGEIYSYWRDLENLPNIMSHLESVENLGAGRSHWIAKGPAGTKVEWDAEIIEDRENELISWRAVEGADVPNEGTVRFRDVGQGTEIHVSLRYRPPGGTLGAGVAKLFRQEPKQQISDDLRKFKRKLETGEIITSAYSQPSGRLGGTAEL